MITPNFTVRQDHEFVYVSIKVTHLKAQNVELRADGDIFMFSLPPYYLRLHFPGNIVDDDRANANFDLASSTLHVKFPKEMPGEEFADLDMLSKLLARVGDTKTGSETTPEQSSQKKGLIQEIDAHGPLLQQELIEAEEFDWQIEQQLPSENEDGLQTARYGFNSQYGGFLKQTGEIGNDINELANPEASTIESRHAERIQRENEKFDADYYLSDKFENPDINDLIEFTLPIVSLVQNFLQTENADFGKVEFTEHERDQMMRLPRRSYLIDSAVQVKSIYLGLIPLIFAYGYEVRTTLNDHTSESAWTVGKIAANVACLDASFTSVRETQVACIRRALAYPLYRNFELAVKIWQDTYYILRGGKRTILKALLDVNQLLSFHDVYYVYAKIVTEDYCAWIQTANDVVIRGLAHEVHNLQISKSDIGWDLDQLEASVE
ncbi:SHQ1 protein-domain-containing protein [Lipomyces japonicus]|uniref:SHQ1 protein-domain-containing protein n=1 Tax=Lipomyces japonicus TaxID=56871 RepID=UPI0034CDE8A5